LSPDDKHLITAHRNLLIKQWDNWREWPNEPFSHSQKTSKCTRTWKAIHTAPIQFMCFDPTSTLLATASSDYTTKIWDTEAQYCTHNLKGALGIVKCVRFHPLIEKVQQCITGSEDGKLRVYDLNRSEMIVSLEGHFSSITCFEYINYDDDSSLNYNYLISSSRDKVMIVWSLLNYSKLYTIPIYEAVESFLVIENTLSAGRHFITMGNEGVLKLWDGKQSKCIFKQKDSLKIENIRKTDAAMQQCIIQSLFIKKVKKLISMIIIALRIS
jgi:U3 small nucleolar RNA-associated protein 13